MNSNLPPSIENIIFGVLASGLTALITHVWRKGYAALTQDQNLRQSLGESTSLVTILQKTTASINATYQIQPPPGASESLLLNGRAVVLFDDLDELLDTSYRQGISGDIESFCSLYPSVPVLVTSRAAAFASKLRQGGLSQTHYTEVLQDLARDFAHQYLLVEVDQTLVDVAVALTQRQRLRGYDAVQLAAALTLQGLLAQASPSPLRFIAADDALLEAARGEGLATDNPNQHP